MVLSINKLIENHHADLILEPLKFPTIRAWEEYFEKKIKAYEKCEKCNGLGIRYYSPENQEKIEKRIADILEKYKIRNTFNGDQSFIDLAIRIVRNSFSQQFACACRKKIDIIMSQKDCIKKFKKDGLDENYSYDVAFQNVENRDQLNAHILLSTFIRKKMYKGYKGVPVYATVYVLKSSDLYYTEIDRLREARPDIIYIINNGLHHRDYDYIKDKLFRFCQFLYEYREEQKTNPFH